MPDVLHVYAYLVGAAGLELALHAKTLGFVHPETGQQMDFDIELPPDMAALITKWEDYARNLATK